MSGLKQLLKVSPALQKVVGSEMISRPQAVKKVWAYIKSSNLQDPSDKREVVCDPTLKAIFETDRIHMLKIGGALSKHFTKP